MTSSNEKNRILLAGLLAVAAATVVIFMILTRSEDEPVEPRSAESKTHQPAPLTAWSATDDSRDIEIRVDESAGPLLQLGDSGPITLTPSVTTPSDLAFDWADWTLHRGEAHTLVTGDGIAGKAKVQATWTFFDGNPQAHLSLQIRRLPAAKLADDIIFVTSHPSGDVVMTPAVEPLPTGIAAPATWTDGEQTLTYTNFNGPRLSPGAKPPQLELALWHKSGAREEIDWSDCIEAEAELTVDMAMELTVTVGGDAAVTRWPIAGAHDAQLIPVFDVAADHPDPELHRGVARDADRWLWRARTLLYGHSSPDDPRYGTGGLLGHGLGGTIVVPEAFIDDKAVQQLAAKLQGTRAELAPRSGRVEGYTKSSRFAPSASCQKLVELSKAGVPAVITGTPADGVMPAFASSSGPSGLAATVAPPLLDGRLSTLLEDGLSPDKLEKIVAQRQTAAFAAPFVATRNPLIGAWHESLLEPERDGHWKVATDLSSALTGLEFWREESPLLATSLGSATRHSASMRQTMWWWDEEGGLVTYNPHEKTLHDATFALRPAGGKQVTVTLEPGVQPLVAQELGAQEFGAQEFGAQENGGTRPRISAVNWQFDTADSAHQ